MACYSSMHAQWAWRDSVLWHKTALFVSSPSHYIVLTFEIDSNSANKRRCERIVRISEQE